MKPKFPLYFSLVLWSFFASAQQNLIETAVPFRKGDKWGYADPFTQKLLCEPVYDSVGRPESAMLQPIFYQNGMVGVLSTFDAQMPAKEIVPAEFISGYRHFEGYLLTKKGNRYWYFDRNGTELAHDQKNIYGTLSEAGNQIPLLIVEGDEPFSTGIIDLKTNKFLFPKQYNLQEISNETARDFEKKLGKKVQRFLLQDKTKKYFALDLYFKTIPATFVPDEKNSERDIYNSVGITLEVASKNGARAFGERCAAEAVEYKSPKKNKYAPEALCNGDFQLIRNSKTQEFGVAKKTESGYNVVVEPVYTSVLFSENWDQKNFFIAESIGKFGVLSESGEVLPVVYDEIRVGDRAFMARKGKTTRFVLDYFKTPAQVDVDNVASATEAKRIVPDDRTKAIMLILVRKNDGTYFYMGSNGKIYYEP